MPCRAPRSSVLFLTLAFAVAACSGSGGMALPSSAPVDSPAVSVSEDAGPAATASPTPERIWPTVSGLPGGWIAIDGEQMGRDGPESTSTLLAALGEPDERRDSTSCGGQQLANTVYRWGDFSVVVLQEVNSGDEYGTTYPPGSVAGWRIDPALDGQPGLSPNATGPEGTAIGTPLETLQLRFTTEDWDDAGVEDVGSDRAFSIFVGDTTGAVFELDATDSVAAMWAGYACRTDA